MSEICIPLNEGIASFVIGIITLIWTVIQHKAHRKSKKMSLFIAQKTMPEEHLRELDKI